MTREDSVDKPRIRIRRRGLRKVSHDSIDLVELEIGNDERRLERVKRPRRGSDCRVGREVSKSKSLKDLRECIVKQGGK